MGRRILVGFCAAVISTLTFHQAMWALLFLAGLMGGAVATCVEIG